MRFVAKPLQISLLAMKPAPGIPDWTPKPAKLQKRSGPEWWHWLIAVVVVVAWVTCGQYNDRNRQPARIPTPEEAEKAKLEAQWESVVRSRRQKEKDFEERTRPR